jgi:type III secretion protein U
VNKNFPPSTYKLTQLRNKGIVNNSPRAIGALCAGIVVVSVTFIIWVYCAKVSIKPGLQCLAMEKNTSICIKMALKPLLVIWFMLGVVPLVFGGISAILLSLYQTGIHITVKTISFQLERLNPSSWITQFFRQVFAGLVNFFLVIVFSTVLYLVLWSKVKDVSNGWFYKPWVVVWLGSTVCFVILLIIALADLLVSNFLFQRKYGMTTEELRKEYRDNNGDPALKARRELEYHAFLSKTIEERVKNSRVIIIS